MNIWRSFGKRKAGGKREPAGQQTIRQFLESGNWRSYSNRNNTPKNADHPCYIEALESHSAALAHVDALLSINEAQQNLIELLSSLGQETDDGLWLPK